MQRNLEPPYPLSVSARRHWDRLAEQIDAQGRWRQVDHDLLVAFCQTLVLAQECTAAIQADGVLVPGARARERVRHPLLTPLGQFQSMMVKLARAIPIANPTTDSAGAEIDALLRGLT